MARFAKTAPIVLLMGILATCSPDFVSGIPCSNDFECPTGYTCIDQKCASSGGANTNGGGDGNGTSGIGFTVEPSALEFGGVQVKDQEVMVIKVKNVAKANAPIKVKATVTGGGDVFKSLTEEFITVKSKSENGSVDVQIAYVPTKIAADTGKVDIMSDEPGSPKRTVTLKGNGIDPDLEVTPGTIDFGSQFKGAIVPVAKVTVKNNGEGTLVIQSIAIGQNPDTQYSIANVPAMPKNLDTNSSFTFDVAFKPSIPGDAPGSIVIKAEDRDKPEAVVSLRGSVQAACEEGKFDINGDPVDGCECKRDKAGGANCDPSVVKVLGPIADDGTTVSVMGNLVPEDDVDWYTVIASDNVAQDLADFCDKFHFKAIFLKNPDNLAMNVYLGCGAANFEECTKAQCDAADFGDTNRACFNADPNISDVFEFRLDTNEPDPADPTLVAGQCPCTQKSDTAGETGKNHCDDDSKRFYIKIFRPKGQKTSCEPYEMPFCDSNNGLA